MRKTGFYAKYELYDTTAREDSTLTTAYNQSFGDITKGKEDITTPDYGTLEQNYFLLDGTYPEMPDIPDDVVFFSSEMSGADGTFTENPLLVITFTENHTSACLTLHLVGDYPLEMKIRWKDGDGNIIEMDTYQIDKNKYVAWKQVENYRKVEIEFTKAKPYRYVKFRYIEYGTDIICGVDGYPVKEAKLVEECDPISNKIAINKLTFKLIDENNDFNIGNMSGLHKVFQSGQKILANEVVNGEVQLLGAFFLDDYSTAKNVTSISCVDYKGLLSKHTFRNGKVYTGESAGEVIDAIMAAAGITAYTVDEETRATPLYGWLKIQDCRKALREVLFACGSVVDSSRSESLNIFKVSKTIQTTVMRTRKFSTTPKNQSYISDVTVKFPVYSLDEESKEILKGTYAPGTYTVDLSSPAAEMTISGGTITEQSNNSVSFTVASEGEVIISGKKYTKEDISVTSSVNKVDAGESRETKSFSCTVLGMEQATMRAKEILDYYDLRLNLKIKFLNEGDKVADWSEIFNADRHMGSYVAGFEKMTTDLTGGYISTAELRGYYKLVNDFYYTGEIIAGEEFGGYL
nr:MAG TPA: hypothetical protein [Caudoviricetes sp.]